MCTTENDANTYRVKERATMQIEIVNIKTLVPDNRTKQHPQKNIDAIARVLLKHGQKFPLVVEKETNLILKGNGTYRAMMQLGYPNVNVIYTDIDSFEQDFQHGWQEYKNDAGQLAQWDTSQIEVDMPTVNSAFDEITINVYKFSDNSWHKINNVNSIRLQDPWTAFVNEYSNAMSQAIDEHIMQEFNAITNSNKK